jgi:2-oxoglutarate ferredoxin oxidoreductase subunit gamma
MLIKSVFAGFGGQGIITMGLNLALTAMTENRFVTFLPAYGAEVRGGTANCTVAISDEEIASPVASSPEFVIAMNQPSLIRFQNQLESGGVLFVNSTLIESEVVRGDIDIIKIPANKVAEDMDNPRGANMVMLGAFVKKSRLVKIDTVMQVLAEQQGKKVKIFAANKKSLLAGYELLK